MNPQEAKRSKTTVWLVALYLFFFFRSRVVVCGRRRVERRVLDGLGQEFLRTRLYDLN
jgi:hypothetical protein